MLSNFKKILYPAIIILFCAFSFQGNPPSGWYLQTLPYTGGRSITDMIFTDSLTGYLITNRVNDSAYVYKTINGGDNWNIVYKHNGLIMNKIDFVNENTGYISGTYLLKTTNAGINWVSIGPQIFSNDIDFINADTGWHVISNGLTGGIFKTTNGGVAVFRNFKPRTYLHV